MFRVSLANAFAKRTLRPLFEKHQATPVAGTLASSVTADVYSGMVAALNSSGEFVIANNTTTNPWGLFALDKNAAINDLDGQPSDLRPFAVWQGGPDMYFRIDAPAMNTTGTVVVGASLYVDSNGKLAVSDATGATVGTTRVGDIVEVVSSTRWVIRLTLPRGA